MAIGSLALSGGTVVLMGLSACVSTPGPRLASVPHPQTRIFVYPTRGQSADQQDRDRYECHHWAVEQSGFDPSAPSVPPHLHVVVSEGPPPGTGVFTGAVAGAVIGAAVSRPWQAGRGAILGALAGATIGGVAEAASARRSAEQAAAREQYAQAARLEEQARGYVRAISACLVARGYEVR